MQKVLISLPDVLVDRMKEIIPSRQRSRLLAALLEDEIGRRESCLHQCVLDVENDEALKKDAKTWDTTIGDGIDAETW